MIADSLTLDNRLKGYVKVENEAGQKVEACNLVVYTGGDIIAQLLAGNSEYNISHMYFAFENTAGTPTAPAAARSDVADYFHSLSAPQDFLRAEVLSPVTITAADVNHNGNRATFNAIAVDSTGVNGVTFSAGSNSKVFSIGLVAAPTGVYTGDVLYARFVLPTALPVVGSGQISATWATEAD